jgi:hypothetical protein
MKKESKKKTLFCKQYLAKGSKSVDIFITK